MDEARGFLVLPRSATQSRHRRSHERGSTPEAALRLFRAGRPILGTPAEAYLRARGITALGFPALRFHPSVYYRAHDLTSPKRSSGFAQAGRAPLRRLPAMLAAITDLDGRIVGVNRTWLDVERLCVADLDAPRKVLGALLGHGIRFGRATDRLLSCIGY